jgi:phosphomevalonate kinase
MKISASAPGKLVVTGEYAVLVGAPALALCVDRRMQCVLTDRSSGDWQFRSYGFAAHARHPRDALLAGPILPPTDPARLCQFVAQTLIEAGTPAASLPQALAIELDSSAGYDGSTKLGIGTSAAVCVALTAALLRLADAHHDPFTIAHRAHSRAQGGRGSGVDIAAACSGGLLRYTRSADNVDFGRVGLPSALRYRVIWTGVSAATSNYLERFDAWRQDTLPAPLAELAAAAHATADALHDAGQFMRELRAYAAVLERFDSAAGLGIYNAEHRALAELATQHGVVYKPCGAGGGDFGMAFATVAASAALEAFSAAARAARLTPMSLELDPHGITVGIER